MSAAQQATGRRGRPTNAALGRPAALTDVERNRRYRRSRSVSVELPNEVAAFLRRIRRDADLTLEVLLAAAALEREARQREAQDRIAAAEEAERVEMERLQAEAEAQAEQERQAAARPPAPADARYYSPEEDERLIELGARLKDWTEIHLLMGRSSPAALKARFQKIEPLAQKAARLGRDVRFRPDAMRRPCMQCRRPFDSAGHHNRLCETCRSAEGFSQDDW